jgi:hypothetical protein
MAFQPMRPPDWRCHEHGFVARGHDGEISEPRPCPVVGEDGRACNLPMYMAYAKDEPPRPHATHP